MLDALIRDGRYAIRMLRKTPGFTIAAVLTLALGIGANAAVFSVVNALLVQPLPYPQPDRLGLLEYHTRSPRGENRDTGADGGMWEAVRDGATTLDAAPIGGTAGVNLVANNQAMYVQQQRVGAGYFHVVGVAPFIGREFTRDEDRDGGSSVVILSYSLWHRVFSADPAVVGRTVTLRGQPYTVVGVLPSSFPVTLTARFEPGEGVDLWTPLKASTKGEGGGTNYDVVMRLHDGVSFAQAQNQLLGLSRQAFKLWPPRSDTTREIGIVPMQQGMTSSLRRPLLMLWAGVVIVLLIACVNVAGLLLARGSSRTREIATRMALGSGRTAVVRQLLVESALLACVGGLLGLALGWAVLAALGTLAEQVFNLWQPLRIDGLVLGITLAIALCTSVLFGLVPALQASRMDVQAGLGEGGTRGVAGAANRWPRRLLVIGEVALGVVLLVGAGLLVRSFQHLRDLNPGFDPNNLVTASVSLQDARYHDPAAAARLFSETAQRLRAVPGVVNVGAALGMPYARLLNNGFRRLDGPHVDSTGQITNENYVTPGFFETLRVPILRGRAVTDADTTGAPLVAVVNQAFVTRYFKDDDPIGRHIGSAKTPREIVGIVGNTQQGDAGWGDFEPISPLPCIYVPVAQTSSDYLELVHTWFQPSWVVRASLPTASMVQQLRSTLASVDPQLPIATVSTIDDLRGERLRSQRFMTLLVAGLGLVALALAAIGIHGLIASSVTERTRELGIRLALGATAGRVLNEVVAKGLALAGIGVAVGIGAALLTVGLLRSFVYGVTSTDPTTFAAVIVVLLAIALVASLVPALRVLRLDPAATLRAE